jgi:putative redox protein
MTDVKPPNAVMSWAGGMRFEGGLPGGPVTLLDADAKEAPGPMVTLLLALASCAGADVVSLMPKMQVELTTFSMEIRGDRAPDHPRRWTALHDTVHLAGRGLDETKARRAMDLSIETYCSAINSLNPDIPVTYDLVLG